MTQGKTEYTVAEYWLTCGKCGCESYSYFTAYDFPNGWMPLGDDIHLCPHCAHEFEQWLEGTPFPRPTEDWIEDVSADLLGLGQALGAVEGLTPGDKQIIGIGVERLRRLRQKVEQLESIESEPDNGQAVKDFVDETAGAIHVINDHLNEARCYATYSMPNSTKSEIDRAQGLLERLWQEIEKL